jgi:hypothetical protein
VAGERVGEIGKEVVAGPWLNATGPWLVAVVERVAGAW